MARNPSKWIKWVFGMTQIFLGFHLLIRLAEADLADSTSSRTRALEGLVELIMTPFRSITDALGIQPPAPSQPGLDAPVLVVFVGLTAIEIGLLLAIRWLDRRPARTTVVGHSR